jgi:uncharacterized protein
MKWHYYLMIGLVLTLGIIGWIYKTRPQATTNKVVTIDQNPKLTPRELWVGIHKLHVEIRDTETGRELGLSYRKQMGADEGMIFVFNEPQRYSFWMKGMNFPLDMIWIYQGKVVEVSRQVPAPKPGDTQIATVTPSVAADQVLEVNGRWAETNGIKVGDVVKLM